MSTEAVPGIAPGNDFAVARVNQELANRSSIGALFVDRSGDASLLPPGSDDHNRTYAIDGRWGIGEHLDIDAWAAKTDTPGLSGSDDAFSISANYSSAEWTNILSYTQVGADFNPEVGFLARSNYRKYFGLLFRRIRPNDLWGLHELRPMSPIAAFGISMASRKPGICISTITGSGRAALSFTPASTSLLRA